MIAQNPVFRLFAGVRFASVFVLALCLGLLPLRLSAQNETDGIALDENAVTFNNFKVLKTSYGSGTVEFVDDRAKTYGFTYANCRRAGSARAATLALQGNPEGTLEAPAVTSRYGFRLVVTYATAGEMTLSAGRHTVSGSTDKASESGDGGTLSLFVPETSAAFRIVNTSGNKSVVYVSRIELQPLDAGDVASAGAPIAVRPAEAIHDLSGRRLPALRRGVCLKGGRKVMVR